MASGPGHKAQELSGPQDVSDWLEKESEQEPLVRALEAGGCAVVRDNWHEHISMPLQTGRGHTQVGLGGGEEPSRDGFATEFPVHRSEKVPVL